MSGVQKSTNLLPNPLQIETLDNLFSSFYSKSTSTYSYHAIRDTTQITV